jgi:hypothetical protein
LVYEKRLSSVGELNREIRSLELDGGIRIIGKYNGKVVLIFVTKPARAYSVAIYEDKPDRSAGHVPGDRLLIREFDRSAPVERFLIMLVKRPFEAYVY